MAPPPRPDGLDHPIVPKILRAYSKANVWLCRLTGGLLGSRWRVGAGFPWGAPVALLTTTGRKSGEPRTAPLIFGMDGDRVVVIASQGGMPKHPLWYRNLCAHPDVKVQIGRTERAYVARTADGEERERLWEMMCVIYADYNTYKAWTDREIPVVVCEPV
jgi:deazaflavin-dependent oxidoreductase (nitroreductase family)